MHANRTSKRISFFMCMGVVGFFAVFVGFGKTLPPAIRDVTTPVSLYIHGAFAFSWLCLFFIQATLIRFDHYRLHKTLGVAGIFIAICTAVSMMPAGVYQVQLELDQGSGESSYSTIVGVVTSATIYLSIVIAGIVNRKNPQTHKRLMLLSTIVLLWVAWFRFRYYFPTVPRPDIWFGLVLSNSLIIIAWIWDIVANKRLHPTLGWVGAFIITEGIFETLAFDSPTWRVVSKHIFEFLTG